VMAIFIKIHRGEIPNISIKYEIIDFKQWLNRVALFFILFNIIDDEITCNRTLLGLCFLFFALILIQLAATFGLTGYKAATIDRFGRAGGFGAPGEYSITLALFFPFVVSGVFFIKRSRLFKIGCIILGFLILLGLINAGSRNGAVSFLVSMMAYILILKRKKIIGMVPILLLIIAMIMASVTAFVLSPSSVKTSISERFDPFASEDINKFTSGRIALLQSGWKLFVDSPIFGHGGDTFELLSILRGYPLHGPPHNEYLKHLVEYGLVGLIVFLLIFLKIIQNTWQSLEITKDTWGNQYFIFVSYFAGLCGFMVGMSATNTGPSLVIFWIYTAVIYKYTQLKDMKEKETSVANR